MHVFTSVNSSTMIRIWMATAGFAMLGVPAFAQPTWRKAYGALANEDCKAVRYVSDDLFIAAGSTGSFGWGSSDIYLVAVDGDGVRQWSVTIGTGAVDYATDMRVAADGGLWIVGSTNADGGDYDGLLVRTDAFGQLLWQRTYGGTDWDFFHSVRILDNGDLLIAGQTFTGTDVAGEGWLLRVDATGETIWERSFGGSGDQEALSAIATTDGGFVLCGSTTTVDRELDAWIAKLDNTGAVDWSFPFGGDSSDVARDIVQTIDGGYSTIGSTHSFEAFNEALHLKVDATGAEQWSQHWGQISAQEGYELVQFPTGEYYSVGYTTTSGGGAKDMYLQKSAEDGGFIFTRTYGGADDDDGYSLAVTTTGFVTGGGTLSYGAGGRDVFLVRSDMEGMTATQIVGAEFDPLPVTEVDAEQAGMGFFPDPSAGSIQFKSTDPVVEIRILDALGRVVEVGSFPAGVQSWDTTIPDGRYVLELTDRTGRVVRGPMTISRH